MNDTPKKLTEAVFTMLLALSLLLGLGVWALLWAGDNPAAHNPGREPYTPEAVRVDPTQPLEIGPEIDPYGPPPELTHVPPGVTVWAERTQERVDYLCRHHVPFWKPQKPTDWHIRGCYVSGRRTIIYLEGDDLTLRHEAAHANGWHHEGE